MLLLAPSTLRASPLDLGMRPGPSFQRQHFRHMRHPQMVEAITLGMLALGVKCTGHVPCVTGTGMPEGSCARVRCCEGLLCGRGVATHVGTVS